MMKDLRDWYSYLEQVAKDAASSDTSSDPKPTKVFRIPPAVELLAGDSTGPTETHRRTPEVAGRPGRRPLTETREEIIRRLLDPELTLHEAAALLNLSKATIRRYTTVGKLQCFRTAGGQRRFKLSDLVTFLEAGERRKPPPQSAQSSDSSEKNAIVRSR